MLVGIPEGALQLDSLAFMQRQCLQTTDIWFDELICNITSIWLNYKICLQTILLFPKLLMSLNSLSSWVSCLEELVTCGWSIQYIFTLVAWWVLVYCLPFTTYCYFMYLFSQGQKKNIYYWVLWFYSYHDICENTVWFHICFWVCIRWAFLKSYLAMLIMLSLVVSHI